MSHQVEPTTITEFHYLCGEAPAKRIQAAAHAGGYHGAIKALQAERARACAMVKFFRYEEVSRHNGKRILVETGEEFNRVVIVFAEPARLLNVDDT